MRIEKHADVKEHELIEARKRLEEATPVIKKIKESREKSAIERFKPGDEVKVI